MTKEPTFKNPIPKGVVSSIAFHLENYCILKIFRVQTAKGISFIRQIFYNFHNYRYWMSQVPIVLRAFVAIN